jgi:hypothetical protein
MVALRIQRAGDLEQLMLAFVRAQHADVEQAR